MDLKDVSHLRTALLNLEQPLALRTHCAFHLRTIGSQEACLAICDALMQKEDSCLIRHELAYILGQMQRIDAVPILKDILSDVTDDVLVRHEAAEALGAIGDFSSLKILKDFCNAPEPEVSETCQLAVDLLNWKKEEEETARKNKKSKTDDLSSPSNYNKTSLSNNNGNDNISPPSSSDKATSSVFVSVDPAPPADGNIPTDDLKITLNDTSQGLFERYRAMFALRNANTDQAALALVSALDDESALVRHEVAYVLGQMQREVTVPGLTKVLENKDEHRMVRHEAAEALGAIGGNEVEKILKPFQDDPEIVVKQSCDVALDTMEYWQQIDNQTTTVVDSI